MRSAMVPAGPPLSFLLLTAALLPLLPVPAPGAAPGPPALTDAEIEEFLRGFLGPGDGGDRDEDGTELGFGTDLTIGTGTGE